jgi:hypothetical protein
LTIRALWSSQKRKEGYETVRPPLNLPQDAPSAGPKLLSKSFSS